MEKIKNSRAASFAAVTAIYVAAAVVGIALYRALPFESWLSLLAADVAATVFTFLFSVLFGNASVYDPYWSVQPIVILACFAVGKEVTLPRVLLLTAVVYWGVRLTANWAYTFRGLAWQDWRYTMLKEKSGALYPLVNFFGIHLIPTLVVYGCTFPAVYAFENDAAPNAGCIVFFLLSVFAATLQLVSDVQMHRYRKDRDAPFMRRGIWKYSRHPNYLGEILMWWGVALSVLSVFPGKWFLLAGAAANTALFLFVSIPMADGRQSAKPGFEEYKKETRMLLPVKKF